MHYNIADVTTCTKSRLVTEDSHHVLTDMQIKKTGNSALSRNKTIYDMITRLT